MKPELKTLCEELTNDIRGAYESGTTLEEAERLAAKFLFGQIQVASALQVADLDARMRKNGVKAIKSAVRTEEVRKHEKKPTESSLDDVVNLNEIVSSEQNSYDEAEVAKDYLENTLSVFRDAHIYFRGIAKGRFE